MKTYFKIFVKGKYIPIFCKNTHFKKDPFSSTDCADRNWQYAYDFVSVNICENPAKVFFCDLLFSTKKSSFIW